MPKGIPRRPSVWIGAVTIAFLLAAAAAPPMAAAAGGSPAAAPTAADLVTRWRRAVHAAADDGSKIAILGSSSDQDGIPATIEERLTAAGDDRLSVKRDFDDAEWVLTGSTPARRDWNGFVRRLAGKELERARTAAFESAVLVFGPPESMARAEMSRSDDGTLYRLTTIAPGGQPVTWSVDATTWLPVTSVRAGVDSTITTRYDDWGEMGGRRTPRRGRVSETDKPDHVWKRTGLRFEAASGAGFEAPRPGPSDTRLDAGAPPIPFTFEASHIVFKAQVNGHTPIGILLDTGADENVIHPPHAAEYGLSIYAKTSTTGGGNTVDYAYARSATFTLPGVEVRGQRVAVLDMNGLERALGVPLGGIVGYDFLSRFVVEIDYGKNVLVLHDPKTWSYTGSGLVVPIVIDEGIPFAGGTLSVPTKPAIPATFVMDFGAAETMTLTSPFVKDNDLARLAGTSPRVNSPAGLEKQFFAQNNVRGHIDRLSLGGLVAESIPVNMSVNVHGAYASTQFSGTVGEGIFHRYRVFLDYARDRIIFEPTAEASKPFPEKQTYGLSWLASGADLRTFTVSAVRPGSPAEQDGFKAGDVLATLDGRTAAGLTLAELRDRLSHDGERHSLAVARGGGTVEKSVVVKLISLEKD